MRAQWWWTLPVFALAGGVSAAPSSLGPAEDEAQFVEEVDQVSAARQGHLGDDLPHPDGLRQRELRELALRQRLAGKKSGRVHEVARGQFVELDLQRTDRVFVVLAEFGDAVDARFGGSPGPLHNQIAQPVRFDAAGNVVDNSTIWKPDFSRQHFEDLYFSDRDDTESMVRYYRAQSSGRYTLQGTVYDWVRVPYNEARYGTNACGSTVCNTVWNLVNDAVDAWVNARLAEGRSLESINAELAEYDRWDRYDYDGDGNFDEPDGYIDHFQIVHAGVGEETGGGAQGTNAIWSHRWYVWRSNSATNPRPDGSGPSFHPRGGVRFGTAAQGVNMWVGDYTIQPENGGLGVFAHEFGHDLGLPDHYETATGVDNPTGFWTIMSVGSYLGNGIEDIGSRPGDLGGWDKLVLGWLDYDQATTGVRSTHKLGPAETNTKKAQAVLVTLPKKLVPVTSFPAIAGAFSWYGGRGNNLDTRMTRTLALPAASNVTLAMTLRLDIEKDWDYAYVAVSTDGGATFTNLASPGLTSTTNPNGLNRGNGLTGTWASPVSASFDLTPYAGKTVQLALRYVTDTAVDPRGIAADDLRVTADGATVFTDDAETSPNGWTLAGWGQTNGTYNQPWDHYYLAEFRQYRLFDETLATGPYSFAYGDLGLFDKVQHYRYQDGLLVWYWDTTQSNNNVGLAGRAGIGRILPIDSHPEPLVRPGGGVWSARVQVHDAPFGLEPTDGLTLRRPGFGDGVYPPLPAVPVFDDRNTFWYPTAPYAGVKVPATGTRIEVINTSAHDSFMQVRVE